MYGVVCVPKDLSGVNVGDACPDLPNKSLHNIFAIVMHSLPPYCAVTCIDISLLKAFKFPNIIVSKTCSQDFKTKRFINSTVLKLFKRFLHYVIMPSAFQADATARAA